MRMILSFDYQGNYLAVRAYVFRKYNFVVNMLFQCDGKHWPILALDVLASGGGVGVGDGYSCAFECENEILIKKIIFLKCRNNSTCKRP